MKILKSTFVLLFAAVLAMGSFAQKAAVSSLYQGIEFQMPVVKEPVIPKNSVSITDFGAKSGGQELCTKAFADAIDAASKKGGGRVVIPRGTWLTGPITLKSNIELYSEIGALIIFSNNKDLYPLVETNFEGFNTFRCMSPVNGRNLENIAITGHGVFDGTGEAWRAVKKEKLTEGQWKKLIASGGIIHENGKTWYPSQQFRDGEKQAEMNVPRSLKTKAEFEKIRDFLRPVMVSLISCKKVLFDGPTFQNSPAWCIHPLMCEDFTFRNMTIRNPWFSQNGDGIDIESCKNSVIHDSSFDVGDDAICIKSGKDKDGRDRKKPNENLIVKNCTVFHGHGGVTVGSEMSSGVKNLHVSNCTFIGTDVGLRFKSNRGRGGVVENIYISNIEMINIPTQAISFNLFYSGRSASEDLEAGADGTVAKLLPVSEETPQFKNIFIKNVNCKGALLGIQLQGLPEMNLENVELENIRMEADYGLTCADASGVKIKNLTLITKKMPVADFKNSKDVVVDGLITQSDVFPLIQVSGPATANTVFKNLGLTNPEKQLVLGKEVPKNAVQLVK
ncbi:MAG: right-handed parallel beta-helix repeat-containing protein [Prolixibacteraceae bacterium]|nr:right-handed parallel beta-helix repeat-containing protein [Prolixibacteraceae bacterium]